MVVTCRIESYKRKEFRLADFPEPARLAPLSEQLQDLFIGEWYTELTRVHDQFKGEGEDCVRTLQSAIRTERLRDMAGNPFFLTAMAALHRPDRPLPDKGAKLMDELVKAVLEESRLTSVSEEKPTTPLTELLAEVDPDLESLRRCLQLVAFRNRVRRGAREGATVDTDILRSELLRMGLDDAAVTEVLNILKDRAGLLQSPDVSPDGETYHFEFAYRFEEFLAGAHLNNNDHWEELAEEGEEEPKEFCDRVQDMLGDAGDFGRQVAIWAAGFSAHVKGDRRPVAQLIRELAGTGPVDDAALPHLELAADIATEVGLETFPMRSSKLANDVAKELRERLEQVRANGRTFQPPTRAKAAAAIGRLGDTREGVKDLDFCWIDFPGFRLARYPVTVSQYEAFVKDGGYRKGEEIWREGEKWRSDNRIEGPKNFRSIFQTPNHPRVGVSWYEAAAFCRWLSGELEMEISLPTQEQWLRAAAGENGRKFPWGNETDWELRCNNYHTGPKATTAVGLYPTGDTPKESGNEAGVADLSGNVREWGAIESGDKDARVLRGGSWDFDHPAYFRCDYRFGRNAGNRVTNLGFRVVDAVKARAVAS